MKNYFVFFMVKGTETFTEKQFKTDTEAAAFGKANKDVTKIVAAKGSAVVFKKGGDE